MLTAAPVSQIKRRSSVVTALYGVLITQVDELLVVIPNVTAVMSRSRAFRLGLTSAIVRLSCSRGLGAGVADGLWLRRRPVQARHAPHGSS